MSKWTSRAAQVAFVGFFLVGQPVKALDEINYLHLDVDMQNRIDFASAGFAARLDHGVVVPGADFGNVRIGGELARDASGILALRMGRSEVRLMPFQSSTRRIQTRLTAFSAGERPGAYGMGKAPIAFLFAQAVCAVGFEVSYYHSAEEVGQLPPDRRYDIRVTAYDRAGEIVGQYLRQPARGTTRQAFEVPVGAPAITGIVIGSTAPEGFGLATLLVRPCALAMM